MRISLRFLQVTCVVALSSAALAAEKKPARPAEFEALVEAARTLPAEFAADTLIRIGSSDKIEDKAWRAALLEDAFQRATSAQNALPRRVLGSPVETAGFIGRAFSQELDTLSLQMRALNALLDVDKAKARALFQDLTPPRVPKVSCDESLAYVVAPLYPVLGRVVKETFTAQEVKDEKALGLLQRYLSAVHSPVQLIPAANMLAALDLPKGQFQAALLTFSNAVRNVSGDDRAFMEARAAGVSVQELANVCKKREVSAAPLIEAYRFYLVRHLIAARCEDWDLTLPPAFSAFVNTDTLLTAEDYFNNQMATDAFPKLREQEMTPAKLEGRAKDRSLCVSPQCQAMGQRYVKLIRRPNDVAYSLADRNTPEWKAQLQEFLTALAAWHQDTGSTPANFFRNKITFYSHVFSIANPGEDREQVLRATLDFLRQNRFQAENRIEWFLPVNTLIYRVVTNAVDFKRASRDLENSDDPVIAHYTKLYRLLPPSPEKALRLM